MDDDDKFVSQTPDGSLRQLDIPNLADENDSMEVDEVHELTEDGDYMNDLLMYEGQENDAVPQTISDFHYPGDSSEVLTGSSRQKKNNIHARCEKCGGIGMLSDFVGKTKRFCSIDCSRLSSKLKAKTKTANTPTKGKPKSAKTVNTAPPLLRSDPPSLESMYVYEEDPLTYDWNVELKLHTEGASVTCFKHVTMSDFWSNINNGVKVEVANTDSNGAAIKTYWIATVIRLVGYKALLRYEGFGTDASSDFWVNLCSEHVHPVGWCATKKKPLVPPKTVQHRYVDWRDFLVHRLTGSRTLPHNFYNKVMDNLNNRRLKKGMLVELVDKTCISAVRVAVIDEVYGGRLHLKYLSSKEYDDFWVHEKSPLVHPIGWALSVGHKIHCSHEYKSRTWRKLITKQFDINDATFDSFDRPLRKLDGGIDEKFEKGMKLEAIDPLNLSAICVSTVMKVLKNDYLMIGIDGSMAEDGSDWFCYHASSPCIFPVGFCEINDIVLTPPRSYDGKTFKWKQYMMATNSDAAPVRLFEKEIPKHGFKVSQKVEAVDLMEPRLICVASVVRVVGRLVRIHFDGWEESYDQWVDCQSTDIYPVGWCDMVGYRLEPPRTPEPSPVGKPQPSISTKPIPRKKKSKKTVSNQKKRKLKSNRAKPVDSTPDYKPVSSSRSQANLSFTIGSDTDRSHGNLTPEVVSASLQSAMNACAHLTSISDEDMTSFKDINFGPSAEFSSSSRDIDGLYIPVINDDKVTVVKSRRIAPEEWRPVHVAHFLNINGLETVSRCFIDEKIDGSWFLGLKQDNIASLTGTKLGPALKVYSLIKKLLNLCQNQNKNL